MTIKQIKLSFYKNPGASTLNLRDAQPIQSTRALAGIDMILKRLSELNQDAYHSARNLDEFTVTLTPISGTKDHGLQISGKNLIINIAKLKPETKAHFLPLRSALKNPISNLAPSSPDTMSSMNNSSILKDPLVLWTMIVSTFRQWMSSLYEWIFGKHVSFSPGTVEGSHAILEKHKDKPKLPVQTMAAQPDGFYDLDNEATHHKSDTNIDINRKKQDRFDRKQKEKLEKQNKRDKRKIPVLPIKSQAGSITIESEPSEIKATQPKQKELVAEPRLSKDLPLPLETPHLPPEPSSKVLEDLPPPSTTFVFKREGERFQMTEARLSDGTLYKSPKVEFVMQSILVQAPYEKISKCSELKVSLFSASQPVVRIQSQDNGGLDITMGKLKPNEPRMQFLEEQTRINVDQSKHDIKPDTFESFAGEVLSCVKKFEMTRKFIQEIIQKPFAKEENVQILLKRLLGRVDQLINSEDPIVERALDHILAQKDSLMNSNGLLEKTSRLNGEIDMVLRHIEVSELDRQLEAQETSLSNSKPPYLTATFTFKFKDANEFLAVDTPESLEGRLKRNKTALQKHEETLASQLKELHELEDLLIVRTPEEQKAKLNGFVAQNAGKPGFEEMLKISKMMPEILGLLKEHEKAYFFQKPIIWAKIISYFPSIKSTFEELEKKLPETTFRVFLFLLMDIAFTDIKKMESIKAMLPELRTPLSEGIAFTRENVEKTRKEVEKCQQSEKEILVLINIAQDRKKLHELYQKSPQAKTEIEQLENTEYPLLGATLAENKKWFSVPAKNRIVQMMAELGATEHEKALNKLEDTRYRYKQEHGILGRR